MTCQDKFSILNGSGEVGNTHWIRVCLRSTNDWMDDGGRFSLERITLPYGGEGYGQRRKRGECEECGIGLAVWRNCQYCLRHSASTQPLAWCLDCEEPEHLSAWEQTRCPEHGGAPILEPWPIIPEEDWNGDFNQMDMVD